MPLYDVIQDLIIHTWIISKIRLCSPALIPSQVKKQEIRLLCFFDACLLQLVHVNRFAFGKMRTVNHQRFPRKLLDRQRVESGSIREQMRGRVHMGSCM